MKNFNLLVLAVFLSFAFLFSSCGNNLSRGKAKKIVLSKISKDDLRLHFHSSYDNNSKLYKNEQYGNARKYLYVFIDKGYMTLDDEDRYINLTDRVMPFTTFQRNTLGAAHISIASFKDIKITGIQSNDNHKRVEYQVFYELNALGKEINYNDKIVFDGHEDLQKYDDGWR